eukprot:543855-Lingulodinium_polyedra.AAC.1
MAQGRKGRPGSRPEHQRSPRRTVKLVDAASVASASTETRARELSSGAVPPKSEPDDPMGSDGEGQDDYWRRDAPA